MKNNFKTRAGEDRRGADGLGKHRGRCGANKPDAGQVWRGRDRRGTDTNTPHTDTDWKENQAGEERRNTEGKQSMQITKNTETQAEMVTECGVRVIAF